MTDSTKRRWTSAVSSGMMLAATMAPVSHSAGQSAGQSAKDDGIAREAIGERAVRLRAMELEPFDQGLWSELGEWVGTPITAASTNGKVVLIGTWASWNTTSTRALSAMNRLAKEHADDGLVVFGLHHPMGWDKAGPLAERLSFPTAHDVDSSWRNALEIDQDPDFYLIDRAGQLRYADIHTSSLSKAVDQLLAESSVEAAGTKARNADAAAEAERTFRQTRAISRNAAAVDIPSVPFEMPGAEAFSDLKWPKSPEMEKDRNSGRRGQEDWVPQTFALPDTNLYPTTKPDTKGKVMVVYFWNHDLKGRARQILVNQLSDMDLFAKRHGRDVVVVGLLTPFRIDNNRRRNNDDEDQWDPEKLKPVVEENYRLHNLHHTLMIDDAGNTLQQLMRSPVNQGQQNSNRDEYLWPYAAIITSDGAVRWGGYIGPEPRQSSAVAGYDDFILALNRIIEKDPGVQARREAEEAYISNRGGN